ncbi:MCE family protein [Lacihabitans sp. LS3-19]|uniref:MlaD family protein n=1 Tax=Lacihabitans sp. LS3-19 TaxID=2487335 RepID=UPI0020CFE2ED|nr:MlaD family protein [Lacihabitans sp. LS3-19]MCP9767048.1 MCE family protein [Lacihabitans sp. LS3-19]
MKKDSGNTWKLGLLVLAGLLLLVITIYYVGKQKHMFGSTFNLKSHFKNVNGLKEGNNVRFSGINIGTVDEIMMISDSSVLVNLLIDSKFQKFIKTDARASVGSEGLVGDKVLVIYPGTHGHLPIKNNGIIASVQLMDMEDLMEKLNISVTNISLISDELVHFTYKINHGNGMLRKIISDEEFSKSFNVTMSNLANSSDEFSKFSTKMNSKKGALNKLLSDEGFSQSLDSTMYNLQTSSKGFSDNMEALKNSFLLRNYFDKKEKIEDKTKTEKFRFRDLKWSDLFKRDNSVSVPDSL